MGEAGEPGDVHDAAVAQPVQVLQDLGHGAGVVGPDRGQGRGGIRGRSREGTPPAPVTAPAPVTEAAGRAAARRQGLADGDRGQGQSLQERRSRVARTWVDDEDAVDPSLGPPAAVDRAFVVDVLDDLEQQGGPGGGEDLLDAGDELEEEGLDAERVRGPGEDQADGSGAFAGQGPGRAVGLPPEFLGDTSDPGPGVLRDARPVVEREGDGALRHAGLPGDVLDRGSAGHGLPHSSFGCVTRGGIRTAMAGPYAILP